MKNKFFDLKNVKPHAATHKEWREWRNRAKAEEPFKYWLIETLPNWLENKRNAIIRPFNDLRYYIRCRVFDRYHIINTGLKPGYADCDSRMLHGMFSLLVDNIEVEKAWMNVVFNNGNQKKFKTPWWSKGWIRFKSFRNIDAGLAYLNWEISLDDPTLSEYQRCDQQAQSAREQLALYTWWKKIRPARLDPMDASGWSDYCAEHMVSLDDIFDDEKTPEEEIKIRALLDKLNEIERAYHNEDTENLIRLVKIREHLWT